MRPRPEVSHWIDESSPERVRDVLCAAGIDADDFAQRVGPALGSYRSREHVKAAIGQPGEAAEYAAALAAKLGEVGALLDSRNLPPLAHAKLLDVLHSRLGADWNALRDAMIRDLQIARAGLKLAERTLRAHPAPRGRKAQTARGALLAAITAEILRQSGATKGRAKALALEVLRAYSIAAPSPDQAEPAKAATRAARVKGRK